jgi:GNAT superfamily N-acetyltransferase
MDVTNGFAVFLNSFTESPSRRAISTRAQTGPLPVVHSEYVWEGQPRIVDDFFIHTTPSEEALAAVRVYAPAPLHYLLVIDAYPDTLSAYTAAGYRLAFIEYLMARSLSGLPPCDDHHPIRRVATADEAARVNAGDAEQEPWVRPGNLEAPNIHHYYVELDGATAARARSWQYDSTGSYVTHVFTHPNYRRHGLGRAVMLRILHDCAARGETEQVLVASEEGDRLYRSLEYERLATILVFEPNNVHDVD